MSPILSLSHLIHLTSLRHVNVTQHPTVNVRFPSIEKIGELFGSDVDQTLIALRDEGSDMKTTSYEVMDWGVANVRFWL